MTLGYTKDSRQMPCSISDVFQTLELLLTTGQMEKLRNIYIVQFKACFHLYSLQKDLSIRNG